MPTFFKKQLASQRVLVYGICGTPTHQAKASGGMQFKIDPDNGCPIYEQIARQIKYAIAEGTLTAGQLVPSVRELAKSAAINPNTVQRAYLDLQNEEVIETLRGRGMAVCIGAKKRCVSDRQSQLRDRLEDLVREAIHAGLESEQLQKMFDNALQRATSGGKAKP